MLQRCWWILAIVVGGCFSPKFEDAALTCGPDQLCPPGLVCGGDGRCHTPGAKLDAGDTMRPAAPMLTSVTPTSPANNNNPTIVGSAEAGTTVTIYGDSGCTQQLGTGTAAALASPGITIPVTDDTTTTFAATATDDAGNVSPCSTTLSYIEDSAAPATPTLSSTIPASPSRSVVPSVVGTAEASSTILVYGNDSCSGTAIGMGNADVDGDFAVVSTVPAAVVTTLSAVARDAAGNTSPCSGTLSYEQNASAVGVPTLTATVPASPSATVTSPDITGTAEPGVTVRLFAEPSCSGTPIATGIASATGTYSISVTVGVNSTTTYYAQAFDTSVSQYSQCSAANIVYTHDSTAPLAPLVSATTPVSPSNSTMPTVSGTAEPSTTLLLFTDAGCTGTEIATGTVAMNGTYAIQVSTSVDATFYAKARDAAGNLSPCSSGLVYDYDATPPGPPVIVETFPESPSSSDNTPLVSGMAETFTTIRIYQTSDCSGGETGSVTLGNTMGFGVVVTVPSNSVTPLSATATDAAGNTSSCSTPLTYVHDSLAPAPPVIVSANPASPANGNTPTISGTAEMGASVQLYTSSTCAAPIGAAFVASAGTFSIPITVANDTTTTLYTRATDGTGNVSACSSASFSYTEDSTAPAAPTLDSLAPSSSDTTPTLTGSSEAGTTVHIFASADCSGTAAIMTSAASGAFSADATVGANSQTPFSARAIDTAGNPSACSTSFTYIHDNMDPAAPTGLASTPTSPAPSNNPTITGMAEANGTVRLFTNATCSSAIAGTAAAASDGTFAVPLTVSTGSTTTFYATVADAAGNESLCSASSVTFTEDSELPAAPTNLATTPPSPSSTLTPAVTGNAEAGTTVKLYTDSACTSTVAFMGTTSGSGNFTIATTVTANTTTTFWATATDSANNASPCSPTSVEYIHDDVMPGTPAITATIPGSPANNTTPSVNGTADAGTTVKLWTSSNCMTGFLNSGPATDGTFSISIMVGDNTMTNIYANATDAANNVSGCSSVRQYIEDSIAPAVPTGLATNPISPKDNNAPSVTGMSDAGATITVYTTNNCTGAVAGSATAGVTGAFTVPVAVANNSTTTFYAQASDAAGNTSNCSTSNVTFTEDSVPPATPTISGTTPVSPSNDETPTVNGSGENGSTIRIYTSGTCAGTPLGTGAVAAGSFAVTLTTALVNDMSSTLYADAIDSAGNISGCSAGISFIEDSTPPTLPASLATNPVSGSNANSPTITGTTDPGATVRAYTLDTCALASQVGIAATANGSGAFGISVTVADGSTTTFYIQARDAAGNLSTCGAGASITYVENSTAIETPAITATTPSSPNKTSTTPTVSGIATTGTTVELFTNAMCTGTAIASGAAAASVFSIANVPAGSNTTTTFYAKANDGVGNFSGCSAGFSYTHDDTAPAAPTSLASTPVSPANNNNPTITGSAESGSTVTLYTSATCTGGSIGSGVAASGTFSITVTSGISNGSTTTIYASATDPATNTSACSSGLVYVEDSAAPGLPTFSGTSPTSPSNTNTAPTINGSAEANSTVKLYSTSDCTGAALATTTASGSGTFSFANVSVAANSSTTFKATATDAANNTSACSTASITYTHDNQPPATPTNLAISPNRANDNTPTITGNGDNGSTISIYTTAGCTGSPVATGSVTAGSFSISPSVADNTTTTFYAKATDAATNSSTCTASGVMFTEDSAAPSAPSFTGSTPTSPSKTSTTPTINGTAEAGSTVALYTSGTCGGTPVATGTASSPGGTFAISVTVSANSSTTYFARATDSSNNASGCSAGSPSGSFTYTHDSTTPDVPVPSGTSPPSPANDNSPEITGTAEAGVTVHVYTSSACTTSVANGVATAGNFSITVSVSDNTTTDLYVRAIDAAGNSSACTTTAVSYTEDSTPPGVPTVASTSPVSPSGDNDPEVTGATDVSGVAIKLYSNSACTGTPIGTGTSTTGGAFTVTATVPSDATTTIFATATDAAGNASACSTTSISYVEDSTAPTTPTGIGSSPPSPSNDNNPEITGNAESGSTVKIYTNSGCTGTPVASGSSTGTFSITVSVASNTQVTYYVSATDSAQNVSGCSAGFTYREDSVANAPILGSTTPPSPSSSNSTPNVNGTGEANATIYLYSGSGCTGTLLAKETISGAGTFSVSVTLTKNTANVISGLIEDQAGNVSTCSSTITYVHDDTPPTFSGPTSAVATAHNAILVSWSSGSDNLTTTANMRYDVCWSLTSGGSCAGTATTAAGATSHSITGLTTAKRYFISVRAVDQTGNTSTFKGPVSDRTWGAGTIVQIASGADFTCALVAEGTVRCWGANAAGQLGDNSTTQRSAPVEVTGLVDVVHISAGGNSIVGSARHACAVKADGTVWCWGDGFYGQLGNSSTSDSDVPVQVTGITNALRVSAGMAHSCATLTNGQIKCWGLGAQGQLGNGTSNQSAPVTVSSITNVVEVEAGAYHTCAALADGTAKCWGMNTFGQLGDGTTTGGATPVSVSFGSGDQVRSIDVGDYHSCAVTTHGQLRCWGENANGRLGTGTTTDSSTPVTVMMSSTFVATSVLSVTAAGAQSCFVTTSGGLRCWGYNGYGQLSTGDEVDSSYAVSTGVSNIKQASVGLHHTCLLNANGTASCVGRATNYQLGNGSTTDTTTEVGVANLYAPELAIAISASNGGFNTTGHTTCALISNGTVQCWGAGTSGQLGNGDGINSYVPASPVEDTSSAVITSAKGITVGERHACLLRADGDVMCWGKNDVGQLGNASTSDHLQATTVSTATAAFAIAAGHQHTCFIRWDGVTRCWGDNQYGALGNGTTTNSSSAVSVTSGGTAKKLSAHGFGGCVIIEDGSAKCWGWNGYGGLGNASTATSTSAVAVSGSANLVDMGGMRWGNCGVSAGGAAKCAGYGGNGQMGNGTTVSTNSTPVSVTGSGFVRMGSGGEYHICAIKTSGVLTCWGMNSQYQLGVNDSTSRSSPTTVTAIADVKDIAPGRQHTCALLADGTPQCWGYGTLGSLGDNDTSNHFEGLPQPVTYFPY